MIADGILGGIGMRTEFCRKSEQETPSHPLRGSSPSGGAFRDAEDVGPYGGEWILCEEGSSLAKPRLCLYGARGAGREMWFGLCCVRLEGKNPLLGESAIPLGQHICAENPCVRYGRNFFGR